MNEEIHIPVLLKAFLECFEGLHIKTFVDGTLGYGGHTQAILKAHPEIERLIAMDQDIYAINLAKERLKPFQDKITFVHRNYVMMDKVLSENGVDSVEGIFIDIGVSSMQLDTPERGFSFQKAGPLDMRMDVSQELTAATVVNNWPEADLEKIFREFGEIRRAKVLAKAICQWRRKQGIVTTEDLKEVLAPHVSREGRKIHPMTRVFQALRIAVNNELGVLEDFIPIAIDRLSPGGRMGVISFHSMEDRIVKNLFRELSGRAPKDFAVSLGGGETASSGSKRVKVLTKKPIVAERSEIRENPRSRSAKMRFIEKL